MRKWISEALSFRALEDSIHEHEAQGWTFHSFALDDNTVVVLFYMEV